MDFAKLYALDEESQRAFRVETDNGVDLDLMGLVHGKWAPSEPMVWRHYMGGAVPKDLVPTGFVGLFLVSDRVVEVLRTHQFTGWSTFPVTLLGKKKEVIPGYHGFAVTGRCGTPDDRLSPVEWRDPVVPNGPRFQVRVGLYFDPNTWTGEDIFGPAEQLYCFVTDAVKLALERAKVTNFSFTRLNEYEYSL